MTVFGSKGRKITRKFEPGDVGYVPMGYGHYVESIEEEDCEMLAVFNSGEYQEISLSEWLASNPAYLLQTNFGSVPPKVIKGLRKKEDLFSDPLEQPKAEPRHQDVTLTFLAEHCGATISG